MKINWKLRLLGISLYAVSAACLALHGIFICDFDYWLISLGAYVGGMLVVISNEEG